jgi:hypothetical protein
MTVDVLLITALYGGYDSMKHPPPQEGDVKCVLLTDDPTVTSPVWDVVLWPKPHMIGLLAAKAPKMLPMLYGDAAASVWVDASVDVLSPTFAVEAASYAKDGFATWPHPWNTSLDAEAAESLQQSRYRGQRLPQQVQRFYQEGLPRPAAPRHTAVVARAHNALTELTGRFWDAEYEWSMADQIGFTYACWKTGVPMYDLPADQAFLNGFRTPDRPDRWLSHHGHLQAYWSP